MWLFLFLWMSWPSPFSLNILIQHQVTAELAPDSQKKWEVAWKDSSFGCVLPTRTQNGLLSLSCKAFAKWRLSGGNGIMANIEASLGLLKALQTCQAGCAEQSKSWELVGASGIKENKVKKCYIHRDSCIKYSFPKAPPPQKWPSLGQLLSLDDSSLSRAALHPWRVEMRWLP